MEETNRQARKELRMRVRVITQTITDLWRHRAMMNPFRSGFYAVELFSHKVMRYLVPVFLMAALLSSAVLAPHSFFYAAAFIAQFCFYHAALMGWVLEKACVHVRVLALPQYFVLTNIASLVAFYKFLRGERYARWEPIREPLVNKAGGASVATGAGIAE
jgi:hypothetical protein